MPGHKLRDQSGAIARYNREVATSWFSRAPVFRSGETLQAFSDHPMSALECASLTADRRSVAADFDTRSAGYSKRRWHRAYAEGLIAPFAWLPTERSGPRPCKPRGSAPSLRTGPRRPPPRRPVVCRGGRALRLRHEALPSSSARGAAQRPRRETTHAQERPTYPAGVAKANPGDMRRRS